MINTDISFLQAIPLLTLVINCYISTTFCMFQQDNISTMQLKFSSVWFVSLSVADNLPFLEILVDICFKPLKEIFRITSARRRFRTEFTLYALVRSWRQKQVLTKMHVSVIFYIVEQNLISVNHEIPLLSISISWLNLKSDTACSR